MCRREALRRWKSKQAHKATYGNLLELFVKAGHTQCAEAVCEVLRKKCKSISTPTCDAVIRHDDPYSIDPISSASKVSAWSHSTS